VQARAQLVVSCRELYLSRYVLHVGSAVCHIALRLAEAVQACYVCSCSAVCTACLCVSLHLSTARKHCMLAVSYNSNLRLSYKLVLPLQLVTNVRCTAIIAVPTLYLNAWQEEEREDVSSATVGGYNNTVSTRDEEILRRILAEAQVCRLCCVDMH
jgi:hypothetical protein